MVVTVFGRAETWTAPRTKKETFMMLLSQSVLCVVFECDFDCIWVKMVERKPLKNELTELICLISNAVLVDSQ